MRSTPACRAETRRQSCSPTQQRSCVCGRRTKRLPPLAFVPSPQIACTRSCNKNVCPGVCTLGQSCQFCVEPGGCESAEPCLASTCLVDGAGQAQCRPGQCWSEQVRPPLCGSQSAPCGECFTPHCEGNSPLGAASVESASPTGHGGGGSGAPDHQAAQRLAAAQSTLRASPLGDTGDAPRLRSDRHRDPKAKGTKSNRSSACTNTRRERRRCRRSLRSRAPTSNHSRLHRPNVRLGIRTPSVQSPLQRPAARARTARSAAAARWGNLVAPRAARSAPAACRGSPVARRAAQ
jgi:hypothetical protein